MNINKKVFIDFLTPMFGEIYEIYVGYDECEKVLPQNEMSIAKTLSKDMKNGIFTFKRNEEIGYNGIGPALLHINQFKIEYNQYLRKRKLQRIIQYSL